MARWLATLFALIVGLLSNVARAQHDLPADVPSGWGETGGTVELPPPPADYRTERVGDVEWTFPAAALDEARDLQAAQPEAWAEVTRELGGEIDDALVIRIGRNPEEMSALAPVGSPPPEYATGVAYPRLGVILLTLTAPGDWKRPAMKQVLAHELSHVALHRAVGGRRLPRWFVEGVAIQQAGEYSLARNQTLWEATVAGNLIPLEQLEDRFPERAHSVDVAYAEAADFVGFLQRDGEDAKRFRKLVRRVGEGMAFEPAIEDAYYVSIGYLERDWRAMLNERFRALPLVISGGGLWVLATLLIVFGYLRRKRQNQKTLARWAAEEAAVDSAERAARDKLAQAPDSVLLFVPGDSPQGREPGVPTIEHEGRSYTLH